MSMGNNVKCGSYKIYKKLKNRILLLSSLQNFIVSYLVSGPQLYSLASFSLLDFSRKQLFWEKGCKTPRYTTHTQFTQVNTVEHLAAKEPDSFFRCWWREISKLKRSRILDLYSSKGQKQYSTHNCCYSFTNVVLLRRWQEKF